MDSVYTALTPVNDFGLGISNVKYSAALLIADTILTIPSSSPRYKVIVNKTKVSNRETWIALNAVAATPVGASFAATDSELLVGGEPWCKEVKAGDTLHILVGSSGDQVGVALYALGNTSGV